MRVPGDRPFSRGRPALMALTFDDGPGEATGRILDCFERHGAAGTFFVLGRNVAGREDVLRRMTGLGCEVGNHTFDHPRLSELDARSAEAELRSCSDVVGAVLGRPPLLMRPPYGDLGAGTPAVAERLGLATVMWSVPTRDWDGSAADEIVERILGAARPGAVVVLHDGGPGDEDRGATVAAVERVVPLLMERGYRLVTLSDLLRFDRRVSREVVVKRHGALRRLARRARRARHGAT